MPLTSELKILITPELRAEIDRARTTPEGTVSLAEWVRGAIDRRLKDTEKSTCGQCGLPYTKPACGPTHALIAHERIARSSPPLTP